MLIEAALKLVSSIISSRIKKYILIDEGVEEQNGFKRNRGCRDGIFSLSGASETAGAWTENMGRLCNLVKAFDSVHREALYRVLEKFGRK